MINYIKLNIPVKDKVKQGEQDSCRNIYVQVSVFFQFKCYNCKNCNEFSQWIMICVPLQQLAAQR